MLQDANNWTSADTDAGLNKSMLQEINRQRVIILMLCLLEALKHTLKHQLVTRHLLIPMLASKTAGAGLKNC